MSDYLDPAGQVVKQAMRRGGPMDTVKFEFICQQCGKRMTLTWRKVQRGDRPACKKCGPGATLIAAGKVDGIRQDGASHT